MMRSSADTLATTNCGTLRPASATRNLTGRWGAASVSMSTSARAPASANPLLITRTIYNVVIGHGLPYCANGPLWRQDAGTQSPRKAAAGQSVRSELQVPFKDEAAPRSLHHLRHRRQQLQLIFGFLFPRVQVYGRYGDVLLAQARGTHQGAAWNGRALDAL